MVFVFIMTSALFPRANKFSFCPTLAYNSLGEELKAFKSEPYLLNYYA